MTSPLPPPMPSQGPAAPSDYSVEQRGGQFAVLDPTGQMLISFPSAIEAQAAVAALQASQGAPPTDVGAPAPPAPPQNWQSSLMTGMASRGSKG